MTIGAGSAMVLHGLRDLTDDIDADAPSETFDGIHASHGSPTLGKAIGGSDYFEIPGSRVDLHRHDDVRDTEQMKGVNGRVMTRGALLALYKELNRPKDQKWIAALQNKVSVNKP